MAVLSDFELLTHLAWLEYVPAFLGGIVALVSLNTEWMSYLTY
jgi:hypothetical protein